MKRSMHPQATKQNTLAFLGDPRLVRSFADLNTGSWCKRVTLAPSGRNAQLMWAKNKTRRGEILQVLTAASALATASAAITKSKLAVSQRVVVPPSGCVAGAAERAAGAGGVTRSGTGSGLISLGRYAASRVPSSRPVDNECSFRATALSVALSLALACFSAHS